MSKISIIDALEGVLILKPDSKILSIMMREMPTRASRYLCELQSKYIVLSSTPAPGA